MQHRYWDQLLRVRMDRRYALGMGGAAMLCALLAACNGEEGSTASLGEASSGTATGSESHARDAAPNYAVVFPGASVNEMTILVTPARWQEMLDDMTALFGARGGGDGFGNQQRQPGQAPRGLVPGQPPQGFMPEQAPLAGGFPGGGGGDMTPVNPKWVPVTIEFNGLRWENVGVRFKGNSTLRTSWANGFDRMPFKLDFDEFEDEYPEARNQRFYGFKQLSLSNNTGDPTYIREAVVYDMLHEAGLVAAKTGFYELFLDRGEGRNSLGIYTVIEAIDDTVIARSFDDASGNIYEADGRAASLAAGVEAQIEASFKVESDEAKADWSDIRRLYEALHAPERTSNAVAWRRGLESVFDVEGFLKWLALSAAIQHWDTYGAMTHNYYLYNNPEDGRLNWISWDHNFVLGASMGPGMANNGAPASGANPVQNAGRGPGRGSTSLDKSDVGTNWPLIRYLMDDGTYYRRYIDYMREAVGGVFEPEGVVAKYEQLAAILASRVPATSASSFDSAVRDLSQTTRTQAAAVRNFLATRV